jgi:hypothetical protein
MKNDYGNSIPQEIKDNFTIVLNLLYSDLQAYARKPDAEERYVKKRQQMLEHLSDYFNAANQVIENLHFHGLIFYPASKNADSITNHEFIQLQKENEKLKQILSAQGITKQDIPFFRNTDLMYNVSEMFTSKIITLMCDLQKKVPLKITHYGTRKKEKTHCH